MKLFGFHIISDAELKQRITKAKIEEAEACSKICLNRAAEFVQMEDTPMNLAAEQACSGDYHRIKWRIDALKYGKDLDDDE